MTPPRALAALATVCLIYTGCGGSGPSGATPESLRAAGVVRIGYANEAPYAFTDPATGRFTGEAPEIARALFAVMGVERVEGVLTEFGSLIPGLKAGRFDVIAAGMYITPERCAQVAFSQPTYSVGEAFVVAAGNPLGLHSYEDLRDAPDATIGVVAGAIEGMYARAAGIEEHRIVTFPDPLAAIAGVRASRVSAYAGTALTVQHLMQRERGGVEQALPFRDPQIDGTTARGHGAFAFRPEDEALVREFDRHLEAFIGTPEHRALVAPFGFTERELPADATTAVLCSGTADAASE